MIFLLILATVGILILLIFEAIVLSENGTPISDKDTSDYLNKIEKEDLINGVSLRWNGKFVLNVKGYTHRHKDNPSIYQTQYTLFFPYYIDGVGVIPIWSKSYTRIKNMFKEYIENSSYKTDKRKKLGLD